MPVEVILGDAQQDFAFLTRHLNAVLEGFAAQVHVWKKAHQGGLLGHPRGTPFHLIVGVAGRDREAVIGRGEGHHAFGGRLFRKDHPDAGAVGSGGFAVGGVVELHDEVAAGADKLRLPGLPTVRQIARGIDGQDFIAATADVAAGLAVFVGAGRHKGDSRLGFAAQPIRLGIAHKDDDVVDDRTVGGAGLDGLDPLIFREAHGNHNILVVDFAFLGHFEGLGRGNHEVGLRNVPAVDEGGWRTAILGGAFGRAPIGPLDERVDFTLRHGSVVRELPVMRVGEPGRHTPAEDVLLDGLGPRTNFGVGGELHRANFAAPMAGSTTRGDDGLDVLVERRYFAGGMGVEGLAGEQAAQESEFRWHSYLSDAFPIRCRGWPG